MRWSLGQVVLMDGLSWVLHTPEIVVMVEEPGVGLGQPLGQWRVVLPTQGVKT